jgi:hypothetical protein
MVNLTQDIEQEKAFRSHAPGYWSGRKQVTPELWNDWKWQLKNRVTALTQLEEHLSLSEEERAGVLLSGDKLALAITLHFFNLIPRENPDDPIPAAGHSAWIENMPRPVDIGGTRQEDSACRCQVRSIAIRPFCFCRDVGQLLPVADTHLPAGQSSSGPRDRELHTEL